MNRLKITLLALGVSMPVLYATYKFGVELLHDK